MKIKLHLALLGALLALVAPRSQAEPLLEYTFNDGTAKDSSGNGNDGTLVGATSALTAAIGTPATSVSGQAGDYALDNTKSTMAGNGGGIKYTGDLGTLSSFTVTMWFRSDGTSAITSPTRLFENDQVRLLFSADSGKVQFQVGGISIAENGTARDTLLSKGEWVFVALSYNAGVNGGLNLYYGTAKSDTLTHFISASTASQGSLSFANGIYFGCNDTGGRALDGYLDNLRVYGSTTGDGGALGVDAIKEIFINDKINPALVPEPSAWALLLGCLSLGIVVLHQRILPKRGTALPASTRHHF